MILITGGGTRVPIDDVRYIGNNATGSFPCKIVKEYLQQNYGVTYLGSEHGEKPFELTIDITKLFQELDCARAEEITELVRKSRLRSSSYRQFLYSTYYDYKNQLEKCLEKSWDTIFLGAAVSDYLVEKYSGKIQSSSELSIQLTPAPKIISSVRKMAPKSKIIGFKLLYDVGEKTLIEAAEKSIQVNDCDGIVANDYWKIGQGRPEILFVTKKGVTKIQTSDHMAKDLVCLVNKMPSRS